MFSFLACPRFRSAGCMQVQNWTIKDRKAESQSSTIWENIFWEIQYKCKNMLGALS